MRLLAYLKVTPEDFLTLSMDDTKLIKWWVDGSYGVHDNMRSHTGVIMSMGKGVMYYTSHKQELNIKISTEMELVATDDVMTQLL